MCLNSKEINVKGQTITGGNSSFECCQKNAQNLLAHWGFSDLPLYCGVHFPISAWAFRSGEDGGFHGVDGLAKPIQDYMEANKLPVSEPKGKTLLDLYNGLMALENKVTYIITAPCSTFSLQIKSFPDVLDKIDRIIIMGSSIEIGNITPYAEFNTFCDPESLEIVSKCPIEKVIYGQEPIDYVAYDQAFVDEVRNHDSKHAWMLAAMLQQIANSYEELDILNACPIVAYDPVLIPSLIKKNYAKIYPADLEILKDGEKRGKTIYTFHKDPKDSGNNLFKAKWCNKDIYFDMVRECLDNSEKKK